MLYILRIQEWSWSINIACDFFVKRAELHISDRGERGKWEWLKNNRQKIMNIKFLKLGFQENLFNRITLKKNREKKYQPLIIFLLLSCHFF